MKVAPSKSRGGDCARGEIQGGKNLVAIGPTRGKTGKVVVVGGVKSRPYESQ